jgi:Polyketide cyclase / dehydrase and lipid transport.
MHMQGRKQLERHATVNAPVNVVYRLFMDNAELANWAPAVDAVIDKRGGDALAWARPHLRGDHERQEGNHGRAVRRGGATDARVVPGC